MSCFNIWLDSFNAFCYHVFYHILGFSSQLVQLFFHTLFIFSYHCIELFKLGTINPFKVFSSQPCVFKRQTILYFPAMLHHSLYNACTCNHKTQCSVFPLEQVYFVILFYAGVVIGLWVIVRSYLSDLYKLLFDL